MGFTPVPPVLGYFKNIFFKKKLIMSSSDGFLMEFRTHHVGSETANKLYPRKTATGNPRLDADGMVRVREDAEVQGT